MPLIGAVVGLIYFAFLFSAAVEGIAHALDAAVIVAIVIAGLIAAFLSPLLAVAALYGAVQAWHWHWLIAVALVFPGFAFGILVVFGSGLFAALSQLKSKLASPPTRKPSPPGIAAEAMAGIEPRIPQAMEPKAQPAAGSSRSLAIAGILLLALFATAFATWLLSPNRAPRPMAPSVTEVRAPDHPSAQIVHSPPTGVPESPTIDATDAKEKMPVRFSIPSFDCAKAFEQAEFLICNSDTLAELDKRLANLYVEAMRDVSSPDALRADQRIWLRDVRDRCQSNECLADAYGKRIRVFVNAAAAGGGSGESTVGVVATLPPAVPAVGEPQSRHEVTQKMQALSTQMVQLAKNSGAHDYFFRLCGLTREADDLKSEIERTGDLFYQFGKYVLGVELFGFRDAMKNFNLGISEGRAELARGSGPPSAACTSEVMNLARERHRSEMGNARYRLDQQEAMRGAIESAKANVK